jgi:threonine/homoserine/homoserine lactone efflux protein
MTLETGFMFAIALILLWVKPGPGQAAIITRSLNDGFFAGFCIAIGIIIGNIFFFIASALGATLIETHVNQIGLVFKIFGAGYLFYIGYKGLQNIQSGVWQGRKDTTSSKEIVKNIVTGLLITLANPFAIFFFIGILPSIVPLGELDGYDILIGATIVAYVGFLVDGIIAALASQVKQTLSNQIIVKRINVITSIGFIMIGAFLLFSALSHTDFSWTL